MSQARIMIKVHVHSTAFLIHAHYTEFIIMVAKKFGREVGELGGNLLLHPPPQ